MCYVSPVWSTGRFMAVLWVFSRAPWVRKFGKPSIHPSIHPYTLCGGGEGGSALVNIRRKSIQSSVRFRKRMTSRSPRGIYFIPVTHVCFCLDRILWFVWWSDVCFKVLSRFFDHFSIDSNKMMPLSPFKGCFEVSSLFFLRGVLKGPFSGCYWITSFEWPQITRLGDNYTLSLSLLNTCTV